MKTPGPHLPRLFKLVTVFEHCQVNIPSILCDGNSPVNQKVGSLNAKDFMQTYY